jgi:hypothetical protein
LIFTAAGNKLLCPKTKGMTGTASARPVGFVLVPDVPDTVILINLFPQQGLFA